MLLFGIITSSFVFAESGNWITGHQTKVICKSYCSNDILYSNGYADSAGKCTYTQKKCESGCDSSAGKCKSSALLTPNKVVQRETRPVPAAEKVVQRETRPVPVADKAVPKETRPVVTPNKVIQREIKPVSAIDKVVQKETRPVPVQDKAVPKETRPVVTPNKVIQREIKPVPAVDKVVQKETRPVPVQDKAVPKETRPVVTPNKAVQREVKSVSTADKVVQRETRPVPAADKVFPRETRSVPVPDKEIKREIKSISAVDKAVQKETKPVPKEKSTGFFGIGKENKNKLSNGIAVSSKNKVKVSSAAAAQRFAKIDKAKLSKNAGLISKRGKEAKTSSLSNLKFLQIQQNMQQENRQFTLLSDIMRTRHDTAKNAINNLRDDEGSEAESEEQATGESATEEQGDESLSSHLTGSGVPDLTITSCTITPTHPKNSDDVRIQLSVQNIGDGDANFPGGAWKLRARDGGGGYSPICYDVTAGATVNCYIDWNSFQWDAGSYNPIMFIDPDNRINESNENNNEFTCPITLAEETNFADLVITNVELTEARPTLQNDFKIRVTVRNQGTVAAEILFPSLIVSSTYMEYVYPPQQYEPWILVPGASATFEKNPNNGYLREGAQNWTFTVDPSLRVTESDENNNQFIKAVTIYSAGSVSGPAPDLTITNCTITPAHPKNSDDVRIQLSVQNIGNRDANFPGGAWKLRVRDGGGGYSPICYDVAAGATVNCSINWNSFDWDAGSYNPIMFIDPDNRIGESNEGNNEFSCPITLVQETNFADLVITNVELTEARPTLQSDFKIRVTVRNQGTVAAEILFPSLIASSTYMEYVYPPQRYEPWVLTPGASATFEKNPNNGYLREGAQNWTFTVDSSLTVTESDENNNQFIKGVTIYGS